MPLTILHVEDSRLVASTVRDTLEAEGWKVETCGDGYAALNRFAAPVRYALLLLDYGLPNVNGVELARYARKLPRYRDAPIIMLSAENIQDEARSAGVDLFLRKPEDMGLLVDAIRDLLRTQQESP